MLVPERLPIRETARAVEALARHRIPVGGVVVNRVLPPEADGAFLAERRRQEADYLAEIERTFAAMPRREVPLFPRDVVGLEALRRVAGALGPAVD